MGNHRSHYDIPLSVLAIPGSVRMLTKKELFKVPLWGKGMTAGEFISIDRHDFEQAKRDLAAARAKMEDGIVLWIAPEGTRSRSGRMGHFKKGGFVMAIESGATIIPMGIRGSEKVLPPKTLDFVLDQEVTIELGAPIEASSYTLENKEELMEEVRAAIARLCGEDAEETVAEPLTRRGQAADRLRCLEEDATAARGEHPQGDRGRRRPLPYITRPLHLPGQELRADAGRHPGSLPAAARFI